MVIIPSISVAFIHIPRTSGIALSDALVRAFPDAQWLSAGTPQMHGPASSAMSILGEGARLFTIMRNPFEIFASHYCFIQGRVGKESPVDPALPRYIEEEQGRAFPEFIQRAVARNYLCPPGGYWTYYCDRPTQIFHYEAKPYAAIAEYVGKSLDLARMNESDVVKPCWDHASIATVLGHCRADIVRFRYPLPEAVL